MSEIAIKVAGVTKQFRLPHDRHDSLKSNAIHLFSRKRYSKFDALKNVDLEIKQGEFFGIVGRNGSGKSTLLKLLAGIYMPTAGSVTITGSLSPFIELGVGFNPELSARDNVFLNGAILGLSRKQIRANFADIIGFAELEDFVDQKLKNFSSGMQVRLAFSIAVQAQSDILLIDEVLAVGDASFQRKCFDVFKRIKGEGKTVVFVSHDMGAIQEYCDRTVLIEHGVVVKAGASGEVAQYYNEVNLRETERRELMDRHEYSSQRKGDKSVEILEAITTDTKTHKEKRVFGQGEPFAITMTVRANKEVKEPVLGITLKTLDGILLFATNTKVKHLKTGLMKVGETAKCTFEIEGGLNNGTYQVSPAVASEDTTTFYDWRESFLNLNISGGNVPYGLVQPEHTVVIENGGIKSHG